MSDRSRIGELSDIELKDVAINDVDGAPKHVVGIKNSDNAGSKGFHSELWNAFEFTDGHKYVGNVLSDLCVTLAQLSSPELGGEEELVEMRKRKEFRTFNIDENLVQFARGELTFPEVSKGNLLCNVDFMLHV